MLRKETTRLSRTLIGATGSALVALLAWGTTAASAASSSGGLVRESGSRLASSHLAPSSAAQHSTTQRALTPQTVVGSQLVGDPGFEGGPSSASWGQISSGHFATITNFDPHTGAYSADLCGYTNCNPDEVYQYIGVPRNVTSASLSYYFTGGCASTTHSCTHANNVLAIGVADSQSHSAEADYGLDASPNTLLGYGFDSINLTSFMQSHAGQVILLVALAQTVSTDTAEFFVDDFSLSINATPDAPANVSAASNAPGAATVSWSAPAYEGTSSVFSYTVSTYDHLRNFVSSTSTASTMTTVTGLTNGNPYYFTVAATNSTGTGAAAASFSVTPEPGTTPPARLNASSAQQYTLPNSDGATWQSMDTTNLSLSITPGSDEDVLLSGNADLWTWNAGFNQDIGIYVKPSNAAGGIAAWKESGGFAGTFSPNAAFVETVYHMSSGITYSVELQWKTNKPALNANISAGAGPISGNFSPSRLVARVLPSAAGGFSSAASTQQYFLSNSDGSTWQTVDGTNLSMTLSPGADKDMLLSGNADLWTFNAGYNQDIGIAVTPNGGATQVVAWKESGGFAGTFSPNAAYVQTVYHFSGGTTYTVQLVWKANKPAGGAEIAIGAGPISGNFSPSRLTAWTLPADTTQWSTAVSTAQPVLSNNDGSTWAQMDSTNLTTTMTPSGDEDTLVSANADLWTANAGFNQDLAVFVTDNGGAAQLLVWKESGGFGGTFSPNAAFAQTTFHMVSGHTYVFSLYWKTNVNASGAAIFAGAGPINGQYSPTRLSVVPAS